MAIYQFLDFIPVVHPTAFVHPQANVTGDVIVGPHCYIGPGAVLRGDWGRIVLEEGVNVQENCTVHMFPKTETRLKKMAHVGHGAIIHGGTLGENVLIGMNAVVMDGVVLNDDVLVAALAFVPAAMEVPPGVIVAGTPARELRDLTDEEKEWKVAGNRDYHNLAVRCHESFKEVEALTELDAPLPRIKMDGSKPLYKTRQGE